MSEEAEICRLLKETVAEETTTAVTYRELGDRIVKEFPALTLYANILRDIAAEQEEHAKSFAAMKEGICPGDDPDLSSIKEAAKKKLSEIWAAAKARGKYEAELAMRCKLDASVVGKRAYDEALRTCAMEKRIAPPP